MLAYSIGIFLLTILFLQFTTKYFQSYKLGAMIQFFISTTFYLTQYELCKQHYVLIEGSILERVQIYFEQENIQQFTVSYDSSKFKYFFLVTACIQILYFFTRPNFAIKIDQPSSNLGIQQYCQTCETKSDKITHSDLYNKCIQGFNTTYLGNDVGYANTFIYFLLLLSKLLTLLAAFEISTQAGRQINLQIAEITGEKSFLFMVSITWDQINMWANFGYFCFLCMPTLIKICSEVVFIYLNTTDTENQMIFGNVSKIKEGELTVGKLDNTIQLFVGSFTGIQEIEGKSVEMLESKVGVTLYKKAVYQHKGFLQFFNIFRKLRFNIRYQ
ncbi:DHHC zinc finger and transmembrane domain-containing protein [Spironucleus salmonicida]|uniref:DHHC zinc finger and transmembrane domain-containing protein n=1 Tax=Spironucleus salmonicida TaxID=348837 RepID=V6LLD1_9EUKA|nr:DHHC zinc finger and transmembrane domain-containing protein [Spironucleus salmonicida]|eukprot:EST44546.1 DHHC zinc finger and transmembrane domain-containing protein [Spironucleus salmonicida]